MPMKSKAQNRLMHAVAEGNSKAVPKAVAKKFVKEQAGKKLGKLPERKKSK